MQDRKEKCMQIISRYESEYLTRVPRSVFSEVPQEKGLFCIITNQIYRQPFGAVMFIGLGSNVRSNLSIPYMGIDLPIMGILVSPKSL